MSADRMKERLQALVGELQDAARGVATGPNADRTLADLAGDISGLQDVIFEAFVEEHPDAVVLIRDKEAGGVRPAVR